MAWIPNLLARPGAALRSITVHTLWRNFCRFVVRVSYHRCEVEGLERFPRRGPLLVFANHPSALIDTLILQSAVPRIIHPLARSGLFRNPLLWPLLTSIQAVPVYRRQDTGSGTARNTDMFQRCHQMLARGEALLIFPEGESHADPGLRGVKTGAARLALGALAEAAPELTVLPVGLNFTDVGRFRSSVLIKIGSPLEIVRAPDEPEDAAVLRVTADIEAALRGVTINLDSWQDHDLLQRLERFFAFRRGKYRRRSLDQRFRALQKLGAGLSLLRERDPQVLEQSARRLNQFERLCSRFGVRDYQLAIKNTPTVVARFVGRSLAMILIALPLALWGAANSLIPYALTGWLAVRFSHDRYQYDTARFCLGLLFFGLFWGTQIALVAAWLSWPVAVGYGISLPPTAALALFMRRERSRILENVKVFFLFLRQKRLREVLVAKRTDVERDLARLARLVKRREA